jgi:hypothetical protein
MGVVAAAEKIVCRDVVIIADAADKVQPRFPGAVFIMAEKSLTDLKIICHLSLAPAAAAAKLRQSGSKCTFQYVHLTVITISNYTDSPRTL